MLDLRKATEHDSTYISDRIDRLNELEKENAKLKYRIKLMRINNAQLDATRWAQEISATLKSRFESAILSCAQQYWSEFISNDLSNLPDVSIQRCKLKPDPPTKTVNKGTRCKSKESNTEQYDFQCSVAFQIAPLVKGSKPGSIAEQIVTLLSLKPIANRVTCVSGFINIMLCPSYVNSLIKYQLQSLHRTNHVLPLVCSNPLKVIIDYSSPNIAKEMHVGHLRSSVIGESIARLMKYLGHDVLALNHLGDWGTQFGMLITYMQDLYPDYLKCPPALSDLVSFYKKAKARFDVDSDFKDRSHKTVVRLQNREPAELQAWNMLCSISRQSFQVIYRQLGIELIDRGESFYQDMIPDVIKELEEKHLITEWEGCKVLHTDEGNTPPLIVQKSDGGYTYDTTDLAAIRQRILQEHGQVVLYVVDQGQSTHLQNVFNAAKMAGWYDPMKQRIEHVAFGVVVGEDGKKFKTRSGETVCLTDLLNSGMERAKQKLLEKNRHMDLSVEEFNAAQKSIGLGCIKYADLCHNRTKDYVFSFDRMLDDRGNTAVYQLYSYTRIQSILRKCSEHVDLKEIQLYCDSDQFNCVSHPVELSLCKQLLLYPEVIRRCSVDFALHGICEYIYELACSFTNFYDQLYCLEAAGTTAESGENNDEITQDSISQSDNGCTMKSQMNEQVNVVKHRVALCQLTAAVLRVCFDIIGLEPVSKM